VIEETLESWMFSRGVPPWIASAAAARCEHKLQLGAIPGISDLTAIRMASAKPGPLIMAIARYGRFRRDALSSRPTRDELRAAIHKLAMEKIKGCY